jgi:hypothetical protein
MTIQTTKKMEKALTETPGKEFEEKRVDKSWIFVSRFRSIARGI